MDAMDDDENGANSDPLRFHYDTLRFHYTRLIEEVAGAIGQPEAKDLLLEGGQVQIGDRAAWFIYDENLDLGYVYVYVDIGAPSSVPQAYANLLRFNLQLLRASLFGITSLHPDNGHVIYTYRYRLAPTSSGRGLIESLLKVVNGLSADALPGA